MKQKTIARNLQVLTTTLLAVFLCLSVPISMFAADDADSTAIGTMTVEGLVRDIACPLQNKKSTSTSFSKDCITMCLKAGSPLGILTSEGKYTFRSLNRCPTWGRMR